MGVCLSDWCIAVHGNTTTKHEMSNGCLSNWCITVHGNTTKHEMSNGCLSDWCIAVHGNVFYELWLSGRTFASHLQEVRVRTPAAAD